MEYIEIYKGYKLTPGVLYHFSQPNCGRDDEWERLVMFSNDGTIRSKIFMISDPASCVEYLDFGTHRPSCGDGRWTIRSATEEERLWFDAWQKARKWVEKPFVGVDKLEIF